MYNGIGLQTARGSGTNGYVQTNRFLVKPRLSKVVTDPSSNKGFEGTAGLSRKANKDILEHDRKRQIQLKLLVLEEKLIDQGYTDSEIAEKMEEKRRDLEAEAAVDALEDGELGPTKLTDTKKSDTQTHQIAARKERQMETLRSALGIGAEIQNKRYAMVPSDSENSNNEDETANGRKKDGNSKKNFKDIVDNTSDLGNVKKSHGNESAKDTFNDSSRHKKQKSGSGRQDDSSDSDEKVVKRSKRTQRNTSSDSDDKDFDAKKNKKTSRKSRSTRRRHDSDSSDSGSETDSSSNSDGGREHGRSLRKGEYHRREVKEAIKKSGSGRQDNSSDSDEKVVNTSKKRTQRKTSSDSDDKDIDAKNNKKASPKSSTRRRHDSDSSDSGSETDSSSNSDGGREHGRSLKKGEYHKIDVKKAIKKPRKDLSSSESDQPDDKKKKISSTKSSRSRRHGSGYSSSESDSRFDTRSSSDSGSDRNLKKSLKKHDNDVHGKNDQRHGKRDLEIKSIEDSHHRSDYDLSDRRRIGKEKARGDDEKVQHERDADGFDTLSNLEKLYQPKEESNISKRKTYERNWDEQPESKSKRKNTSDLEYNDEVKHSVGGKLRSDNQISDRWGAEHASDYDVVRRESGEDRERQGRKHRRDEEKDTPRINDKDAEQQQLARNRREQDDRKSSRYDRDRDHDTPAKRARYDDSRSGRRYDDDDDRHGRKHSDGRRDERRSRR